MKIICYISAYVLCVFILMEGIKMSIAQQPQPGGALQPDKGVAIVPQPSTQDEFRAAIETFSPQLAERYIGTLNLHDEKKEVESLLSIRTHLKKEFADWENLDEHQKLLLEKSYRFLWQRLLELRLVDEKVLKEYSLELHGDGNQIPSAIYALRYTVRGVGSLYLEFQKELSAIFEETKNAATINNCCCLMVLSSEMTLDKKCWDMFHEKRNTLQSKPLTEHTAMGIILIGETFSYRSAKEAEERQLKKGTDTRNLRQHPVSNCFPEIIYLSEMEEKMKRMDSKKGVPSYAKEIKRMMDQQNPNRDRM